MSDLTERRLAAGYLLLQALLAVVWWIALFTVPAVRERFELAADRRGALDAFLVADGIVFVGGSAVAALSIWRRSRWAPLLTAATAGGVAYATLYLLGWAVLEGTGVVGVPPMLLAMVATATIAVRTRRAGGPADVAA